VTTDVARNFGVRREYIVTAAFNRLPIYNIYNIFIYCNWVVTRWQWLFYM